MTDPNSALPAAGWYPDPAGTSRTRWWDGTRWTENYSEAATPAAATPWSTPAGATPEWTTPAAAAPSAYPAMQPYGVSPALKAPEGTSPSTSFIWLIAALPLISLAFSIAQLATIDETIAAALDPDAPPFESATLINYGIALLLSAATVLFAFLDSRTLAARGIPRPFHWAWSFFALVSAPVYIIGRSVVVRRRTGAGLAPMFVNLSLLVVNFVVGAVAGITLAIRIVEMMPGS